MRHRLQDRPVAGYPDILEANQAMAGHRCALNVNIPADLVRRGSWIVALDVHRPVERADCRIRLAGKKPIRSGTRAHVHLGTADVIFDRKADAVKGNYNLTFMLLSNDTN